jgi:hypothetical protein
VTEETTSAVHSSLWWDSIPIRTNSFSTYELITATACMKLNSKTKTKSGALQYN